MDDQNLTLERRLAACLERNTQLEAENERLRELLSQSVRWVSNYGYNLGLAIEIDDALKEGG